MKRILTCFVALVIVISSFMTIGCFSQTKENTNNISYEDYTNDEDDDGGVRG